MLKLWCIENVFILDMILFIFYYIFFNLYGKIFK